MSTEPHEHQHQHAGNRDPEPRFPETDDPGRFWEEFYGPGRRPWSGRPNAVVVDELTARPLPPGRVLDLGSGSGADAVWFAQQGWTVTGVDISATALAAAAAAARDAGVADQISWLRCDLESAFPSGTWDLVVASYLHSPVAFAREQVLLCAAAAVAPGGTLLVLGHEGFPTWQLDADALEAGAWTVVRAETLTYAMTSPHTTPDGEQVERTDHVLRLCRAPEPDPALSA